MKLTVIVNSQPFPVMVLLAACHIIFGKKKREGKKEHLRKE